MPIFVTHGSMFMMLFYCLNRTNSFNFTVVFMFCHKTTTNVLPSGSLRFREEKDL